MSRRPTIADRQGTRTVIPSNAQDWRSTILEAPSFPGAPALVPVAAGVVKHVPSVAGLDPTRDYADYPATWTPRTHPMEMDPVTGLVHTPMDTPPRFRVAGAGYNRGLSFTATLGEEASPVDKPFTQFMQTLFPWVFPSAAGGLAAIWPKFGYSRNTYSPSSHRESRRIMRDLVPVPAVNRNIMAAATRAQRYTRVGTNPTGGFTTKGNGTGFRRPRGVVTEFPLATPTWPILGYTRPID